jgi:hypothetical protein
MWPEYSGGFIGGAQDPPPPLSPKIYHQMLVKLKIWDPIYEFFILLFQEVGPPPPFLEWAPPFRNFRIRHWNTWILNMHASIIYLLFIHKYLNINISSTD